MTQQTPPWTENYQNDDHLSGKSSNIGGADRTGIGTGVEHGSMLELKNRLFTFDLITICARIIRILSWRNKVRKHLWRIKTVEQIWKQIAPGSGRNTERENQSATSRQKEKLWFTLGLDPYKCFSVDLVFLHKHALPQIDLVTGEQLHVD
jgi:hypothetical protein